MTHRSFGLPAALAPKVQEGVRILRNGGLVAFPTDTLYGLGASIAFPAAIERIYEVKKRPRQQALPLLLSDFSQLEQVADSVSSLAERLGRRFWPGGLTIVLRASKKVPEIITAGAQTVAVRVPDHPVALALISGAGHPVAGTSANVSGGPPPVTADEVCRQLGDNVDLIIDAGPCPLGRESTIIDATGDIPMILREGAVAPTAIREFMGKRRGGSIACK